MKRFINVIALSLLLLSSAAWAQRQEAPEKGGIYAIVKDADGGTVEGYLRLDSDQLTVRTKENQEKIIPAKYVKSITLEKNPDPIPGGDPKREPTYSVRLENSQEIFTLAKKYSFSLNTNLGLVTKTIDPDQINKLLSKDSSAASGPTDPKSFIQDKSVVFSLEFKF